LQYVEKAIMDSVQAANLNREDLSNFLSTNSTCRVGRTAQVSDDEIAAFNGGGSIQLADGETERLVQGALDLSSALVMIEVLNQIEWMHISGDSTNGTMEGGETDGLLKFITAGGTVVATGGSSTTPINFAENFIKNATRTVQLAYPAIYADTLLVATELIPDINLTVQSGSSRPIVQVATAQNQDFVAGASVGWYNTGYSVLKIKEEPYLSPIYNASVSQPAMLAYNSTQVRHAQLIPLSAQEVARTDTSLKRAVTTNFAQEHRVAKSCWLAGSIRSAVS
jgi:hypothetical protein